MLYVKNLQRSTWKPRYSDEEFAQRADAIYAKIKGEVEPGNDGKILLIDVETGEYAIDNNIFAALDRVVGGGPDAQIFCIRIGNCEGSSLHRKKLWL